MERDTISTMMSSGKTTYETPDMLYNFLHGIFEFELDVCATADNAKHPNYITPEQDALCVEWDKRFFMNPPYGRGEKTCRMGCVKKTCAIRKYHISADVPGLSDWVDRAAEQARRHRVIGVCLLPSRTGEKWIQRVFDDASLILFVRGRLCFRGADWSAPFPSIICVFGDLGSHNVEVANKLSGLGNVVIDSGIYRYKGDPTCQR